jgi:hypothetical protein
MDIKKLPSDMSKAGNLFDAAAPIKFFEAGIAIGMQPAIELFEMISWPLAPTIRRELVERCWMGIVTLSQIERNLLKTANA